MLFFCVNFVLIFMGLFGVVCSGVLVVSGVGRSGCFVNLVYGS